jgi:hypothetical protein
LEAVHERRAEDKGQQELQQEAKETQDCGGLETYCKVISVPEAEKSCFQKR